MVVSTAFKTLVDIKDFKGVFVLLVKVYEGFGIISGKNTCEDLINDFQGV